MKKTLFIFFFIIIFFNLNFLSKFNMYDSISSATGGGSTTTVTSVDKSKESSKKNRISFAKKIILTEEAKQKNELLKLQIDGCFNIIKSLKQDLEKSRTDIDVISIYAIIEDNNSITSKFNEKELKQIKYQINKINASLFSINNFLEQYDQEKTDNTSLKNLKKVLEVLSAEYRAIQWILYI